MFDRQINVFPALPLPSSSTPFATDRHDWHPCWYGQLAADRDQTHVARPAASTKPDKHGYYYEPAVIVFPSIGHFDSWDLNQGCSWGAFDLPTASTDPALRPWAGFRTSGLAVGHAGVHYWFLQFSTAILPTDFYFRTVEHSRFKIHSIKCKVTPANRQMLDPVNPLPYSVSPTNPDVVPMTPRLPGLSERYSAATKGYQGEGPALAYDVFAHFPMRVMSIRPHFAPGASTRSALFNSFHMSGQEALDRVPVFDVALRKWGREHKDCQATFESVPKEVILPFLTTNVNPPSFAPALPDGLNPQIIPLDWVEIPRGGFYNAIYCADLSSGACVPPPGWSSSAQPLPPLTTPMGHFLVDTSQWPNSRVPELSGDGTDWNLSDIVPGLQGYSLNAIFTNFHQRFEHSPVGSGVDGQAGYQGSQRPFNPPLTFDVEFEVDVEFDGVPTDAEIFQDDTNVVDPLCPAPVSAAPNAPRMHVLPPTASFADDVARPAAAEARME